MLQAVLRQGGRVKDLVRDQDSEAEEFGNNRWVDATAFLSAFAHLRIQSGKRLACLYTASSGERTSRLLVLDLADVDPLPELPRQLQRFEMGWFLGNEPPLPVPKWISTDVMKWMMGDGTPEALFEKSMMSRWVTELLNFGHGVFWPRHTVLLSPPPEYMDWDRVRDRGKPRWKLREGETFPIDWRPVVIIGASLESADIALRGSQESRHVLGHGPFDAVVFYSYSDYVSSEVYRYIDCYRDDQFLGGEVQEIASGGGGYVV